MEQSKTKTATAKTLNPHNGALVELRQFVRDSSKAFTAVAKASAVLVKAAIHSGEQFADTVTVLYGEIRIDANGIAKAIGAERNKAGDAYVVPNSIMAQVSQVLRAVKAGVDLGTAEKPKGLGEIRAATKEAAEAAEAAATVAAQSLLTGDDATKLALVKALQDAIGTIKASEGPTLEAMRVATVAYCEVMVELSAPKATEATTDKAAEIAAAAGPMLANGKARGKGRARAAERQVA